MKEETSIQNQIRICLSQNGCIVHRINVGLFYTKDGRPIRTGVPTGFSDLFGHVIESGKAFYIETKTPIGKASKEQKQFIKAMKESGAIVGFARSTEQALNIIRGNANETK